MLEFGPDQGLQGQVVDVVRMLLDPDSMDQSPEKDPFLELFYDKYVGELINLLIEGAEQNQQQTQEQLDAFRRQEQVQLCNTHSFAICRLGTAARLGGCWGGGGVSGYRRSASSGCEAEPSADTGAGMPARHTHAFLLCRICMVS